MNDAAVQYYDASTAHFASADPASDLGNGLDRLAYVGSNIETLPDPSGHVRYDREDKRSILWMSLVRMHSLELC